MNNMDAKALQVLEHYVDEYKIFIDTCSFMFDKIEDFLSRLMPIVERKGLRVFVPNKCKKELEKHSQNKSDIELANRAYKGLALLEKYEATISVREDKWESTGSFADNVFKTVFTMHRDKYNLLLITQDNNLAREIKELNNSKAVKGHKVEAKRINKYGFLSHYDWEENSEKVNNNEKNICAFKLCRSVTNISVDPIKISSVPTEGSVVYAEDNSAIKIGARIAGGGEGDVYETNTPYVAKIYKENKLDKRREEKIKRIIQKKLQCTGICFPISALANKKGEFVGYLMPRAKGMELSKSIFLGKMMIAQKLPNWKKKDLVQLCITILEKVCFLHSYNIILGDINGGNILIVSPTEIYFVDVDSYQIEDIPCPVGVDQFTPREILGKDFKSFLRTFGNEYYALSTLLFKIMLPGKSPYAQQGGADLIENIQKMDFSFPFEEKSNKKTPPGAWGFIWSHLSYKAKRAFYNTFSSDGDNSTEANRIPPLEWLNIFKSYYYELTDGNMVKNDSMSNEIFPTRLKNSNFNNGNADSNLAGKTIRCKICASNVDEALTTKGICNSCLRAPAGVCKKCGKPVKTTNYDLYIKNYTLLELCENCNDASKKPCSICGKLVEEALTTNGICNTCLRAPAGVCKQCGKPVKTTNYDLYVKNFTVPELCKDCYDASRKPCVICGSLVDKKTTEKGICKRCLDSYRIVNCSKCGRGIRFYGRQEHLERIKPPSRCDKCQVYTKLTCSDCYTTFEITIGEKEFYDKQGFDLPKRCKSCKQKQNAGVGKSASNYNSTSSFPPPYASKPYTPPQPRTTAKPTVPKTARTSSTSSRTKTQDFLAKKKEIATRETERYFDKLKNIADRKLGFFAKISFNSKFNSNKSKILRLIGMSRSKDDLESFIDDLYEAKNDLDPDYLEDLDEFMDLINSIVDSAEMSLEN